MWRFSNISVANSVPIRVCSWFFFSTKPPAHPEDGDGVSSWNIGRPSHLDTAVCPRKCHWILSLRKLKDLSYENNGKNDLKKCVMDWTELSQEMVHWYFQCSRKLGSVYQLFKDLSALYHIIFCVVNFTPVFKMTVGDHSLRLFLWILA